MTVPKCTVFILWGSLLIREEEFGESWRVEESLEYPQWSQQGDRPEQDIVQRSASEQAPRSLCIWYSNVPTAAVSSGGSSQLLRESERETRSTIFSC